MDLSLNSSREPPKATLTGREVASLVYHDIFEYPLTLAELIKWQAVFTISRKLQAISYKNRFYFLKGREGIVYKRLLRKRISERKLEIAKKAGQIISLIPSVKTVGVTGALAMKNATEESDVDLMMITKKGTLWTTRLLSYFVLRITNYDLRKPGDQNQRDKLCLNMWFTENRLTWPKKDRNVYTAHEIAQILPLVNKDETYEKFLWKNRWLLEFWPNSIQVEKLKIKNQKYKLKIKKFLLFNILFYIFGWIEKAAYHLQYSYMEKKITREIVTPTRAIFHPNDWGKIVLARLRLS